MSNTGIAELITVADWMFSVGDIATQKMSSYYLAAQGVPVLEVNEYQYAGNTAVIGGGHLLGFQPHLKQHVVPGPHVLNAAGVHANGDYGYLKEYKYVSVRDKISRDLAGRGVLVPCPATLLGSHINSIYRRERSRQRGGQIVVHRDPQVERAMSRQDCDMLIVDPQPNRSNPWTIGGRICRPIHSPYLMCAELIGAYCVVTRSLHLAIFALAMEVPFCCIDLGDEPQSNKMRHYFDRIGMADVMYDGNNPVHHAVSRKHNLRSKLEQEAAALRTHFSNMAAAIKG